MTGRVQGLEHAAGSVRGRLLSLGRRKQLFGLALIAPALIFVLALVVYPLVRTFWLSVHDGNLASPRTAEMFVGLEHFITILGDPDVWRSALVTALYTVLVTAISYFVGLGIALLLNNKIKGIRIARTFVTLPWAVPAVVGGYIFIWLVDSNFGIINSMLQSLGIIAAPIAWLSYGNSSFIVIVWVAIWRLIPFSVLTNLAGLQAVPGELVEACSLDGATGMQRFRYLTWPALGHVRTVTVILTFLFTFREFGQIYVITGGGPAGATETLSVRLYQQAFQFFQFGDAAALGVLMLIVSVTVTWVMLRLMNREFH